MTADWPIGFNNIFQPSTQVLNEMVIIISIVAEATGSNRNRRGNSESCKQYYILMG